MHNFQNFLSSLPCGCPRCPDLFISALATERLSESYDLRRTIAPKARNAPSRIRRD